MSSKIPGRNFLGEYYSTLRFSLYSWRIKSKTLLENVINVGDLLCCCIKVSFLQKQDQTEQ